MRPTSQLLKAASDYSAHKCISERYLSDLIFSDNRSIMRLRNGGSITLRNYEKAMEWLAKNWPADLPWPKGVQRIPPKTKTTQRSTL